MSLRAWYVLNGNVKNQGLGDFELTQVTAPTWATGKLCNQALNGGAFDWSAAQTASILNNNELSYSAWIYVGDADTRSMIFGTDTTPRRFCLLQYPTKNDFHYSWAQTDTGSVFAGVVTGALPTGKWTHIAFAYKSGTAKYYINGELVASGSPKVNISTYSVSYRVIHNNTNHRLQDIRIYDHCLSLKEVKELSKGMCLHYKLDDQYSIGQKQLYSGTTAHGYSTSHPYQTKLANEDGYNFKMTYTGTGGDNWFGISYLPAINHTALNVNKNYIWSSKVRCNTWSNGYLSMRSALVNNDYFKGGSVIVCDNSKADGVWHQYSRKLQLTDGWIFNKKSYYVSQSGYDSWVSSSDTSARAFIEPRVEFMTSSLKTSGVVFNIDLDIKEVQLIEADEFPGWIDNDCITDVVDCAGVNNKHLTNYKSCVSVPSPVYKMAYNFNKTGYCYNSSVPLTLQQFTISFWFNAKSTANQTQHFLFGSFDNWTGNGMGIWRDPNKTYYSILFRSDAESSPVNCSGHTFSLNVWNHYVIWWNGTTVKTYLNGVLKANSTYGSNGNCIFKNIYLGNSMFNNHPDSETEDAAMSDFRVYATALTEADILELYKTRASVDNDKNLYGYYFKEV